MASKERCTNRPVTICMCLCAYFIACTWPTAIYVALPNCRTKRQTKAAQFAIAVAAAQREWTEKKKWGKKTASTIWKIRENCVAAAAIKVAGPPVHLFLLRLQSLLLLLIKLNNPINHFVLSVFCCENSNMCYDCESLTDSEFPFTHK